LALGAAGTVAALLRDYDAFLFDCDGTLYQAGTLLPHVAEALRHLRSLGKSLFFVTNTSSRSREQLQAKLAGLGVACAAEECVPSCAFAADYVRRAHPGAERVYVIGGQGLVDEFARVGIAASGGPAEDAEPFSETGFQAAGEAVAAERYDGVVVGWDTGLTFAKISKSALVFQTHPDAFFYATNDDPADRLGRFLLPGNGPLLKAVEGACKATAPGRAGRPEPYGHQAQVLGKPNPAYARRIAEWHAVDLARTVVVGDRLDTDILMGQQAGMASLFVLTGVDGMDQIAEKQIRPDFILPQVGALWTGRLEAESRM